MNTLITLEKNPNSKSRTPSNISTPCTIKTALTHYLDINSLLKARQLEVIILKTYFFY